MVPVVLGFVPTDSIVMLTFGADRAFHARVDLPPPGESTAEVVDLAARARGASRCPPGGLRPLQRGRPPGRTRLLAPGGRLPGRRDRGHRRAPRRRSAAGSRCCAQRRSGAAGVPYDVSAHAVRRPGGARRPRDPRIPRRAGRLDPDRPGAEPPVSPDPRTADQRDSDDPAWVCDDPGGATLPRARCPSDAEAARLLAAVELRSGLPGTPPGSACPAPTPPVMSRSGPTCCAGHPTTTSPDAAAILGLVAWLTGHGALAWCAVDRAVALDPGHSLAGLVGRPADRRGSTHRLGAGVGRARSRLTAAARTQLSPSPRSVPRVRPWVKR